MARGLKNIDRQSAAAQIIINNLRDATEPEIMLSGFTGECKITMDAIGRVLIGDITHGRLARIRGDRCYILAEGFGRHMDGRVSKGGISLNGWPPVEFVVDKAEYESKRTEKKDARQVVTIPFVLMVMRYRALYSMTSPTRVMVIMTVLTMKISFI